MAASVRRGERAESGTLEMMEMFCILTASRSISWLCSCIKGLQEVTLEGNWLKEHRISALFLMTTCQLSQTKKFN